MRIQIPSLKVSSSIMMMMSLDNLEIIKFGSQYSSIILKDLKRAINLFEPLDDFRLFCYEIFSVDTKSVRDLSYQIIDTLISLFKS